VREVFYSLAKRVFSSIADAQINAWQQERLKALGCSGASPTLRCDFAETHVVATTLRVAKIVGLQRSFLPLVKTYYYIVKKKPRLAKKKRKR
jgi:hypothetical protein